MQPNFIFLCCLFATVWCVIKVNTKLTSLHVQCQWWFYTQNAGKKNSRKTISWCNVLLRQSSRYGPEFTTIKAETALRTRKIRLRNVFGWLGFVEQILKIAQVNHAGLTKGWRRTKQQQPRSFSFFGLQEKAVRRDDSGASRTRCRPPTWLHTLVAVVMSLTSQFWGQSHSRARDRRPAGLR